MMEVLSESVRLVNLPFTVLLGFVILYWVIMGIGLIDFDTGADAEVGVDVGADADAEVALDGNADAHLDVDGDGDMDVDGDGDADAHAGGHAEPGWFTPVLQFLNVGQVPMMVVLSIMTLAAWTISMALNYYWRSGTVALLLAFLGVNLVLTCVVTHFATRPFKSLFKALNKEYEEHLPIIGRTCTVTTSSVTEDFGQAQIATKGAPILINVRTSGDAVLRKGETGLVIKEDKEKSIYTIIKVTADKLEA